MTEKTGKLYVVTTPIGNLEDITLRALRILKEADLIAAEDTRRTRKLLTHYDIHTRLISYHAHNEHRKTEGLLQDVLKGNSVAVVSDAGTPGIADPGFLLVREAVKAGIEPEIIPGVSSLTFAAVAAALPIDQFVFYGFPPVKSGRRKAFFEQIGQGGRTAFIFESPYRIEKALQNIVDDIGGDARVAIVREATKLHEEVIRGTAAELLEATRDRNWKGECVIGIKLENS